MIRLGVSGWQRSLLMFLLALTACVAGDDDEDDGCDPVFVALHVDQPETASLDFGDDSRSSRQGRRGR
jgi:hypothetical protein